ncbi:uncharacterized protein LOC126745517 [Anthonomus grandis grandis]|uniref:uncharacterized protein LOC126745517 n=1 Tax=Anthonomus grandis grandis TaxID=2921223 RepID=UPI00216602FE|nr:uncharacterized protein LOC126745517 [Anthonomus grandis grandis]XP_050309349.1 uncharacterized protein LOC126745517 [Anthonomus grandis grandis]
MKRKLDLVLSNMQITSLEHCGNPILDEDQYHPALSMVLPISLNHIKNHHYINYEYIYDYSMGDFYRLYTLLREVNWAELERADNVDMCTHVFYQKVYECLDLAIPRKKVKIGTRKLKSFPKYFSQELKKNIKLKTHLHKQIKKGTANFQIRNEYSKIRSTVKYQTAHELRTYHENIERNVKTNPNSFWDFVRSGRLIPGVPAEVCYGECTVSGAQEIADTFALYFSSVFQQSEKPNFDKSSGNFSFSKISEMQIQATIKRLKSKKATGNDSIPSYIYKGCSDILCTPLKTIFNLCLKTNTFPEVLKYALVTPILKSGDNSLVDNYRPISVLTSLAKMFENILYQDILSSFMNKFSIVGQIW